MNRLIDLLDRYDTSRLNEDEVYIIRSIRDKVYAPNSYPRHDEINNE